MRRLSTIVALVFAFATLAHAQVSPILAKAEVHPVFAAEGAAGSACTANCTAIQASWTAADFAGVPACSSTVTLNCVSGYTLVITPPTGSGASTETVPACTPATQTAANCIAAAATSYKWSPGGALYYGTWTLSLTTTEVGATSTSITQSTAATYSMAYNLPSLNPPTGVTATPVQ